jgi:hypothetical protein
MDKTEFIASIRHIGWVTYQIAARQPYNEEINSDQLESLMDGVDYLERYHNEYGRYPSPAENHENWMRMKIAQGWVQGEVKDFEKKTHPDLVPFIDLPEIEKRKDISDYVSHRLAVELWNRIHDNNTTYNNTT